MKKKMMSFKQFNEEVNEHRDGTYVSATLCDEDKETLYNWVTSNGISDPLNKDEYHVTVIYSRTPCPEAANYDYNTPITGNITGWKIFEAGIGRCLVAHIESEQLQTINADLQRNYGATSDFPEYIPHITVSYSYEGTIPDNYPAIKVKFDKVISKGLDVNWRPTKGD
jgi:hypothetical protein